jgi:threonine/homoserine/homoserine lactone efflux protein
MDPVISLISTAVVLGATSGLTPGPLLTLVAAESFRHGFRSGAAVAIAPILTDAPIVLLMMLLANAVSSIDPLVGALYFAGSGYLVYLSIEIFRIKGMEVGVASNARASLVKGIVANLLNPAPYIFWITVGAPLLVRAKDISWSVVAAFLGAFYAFLVGMKLVLAMLIGKNRRLLEGRYYRAVMRCMGLLLLFFAVLFIKNGIEKII